MAALADDAAAHDIVMTIVAEAIQAADGYAARDILHSQADLLEPGQRHALASLVTESGLGGREIPVQLRSTFDDAVRTACLLLA
jgi:hypothetical protein